MVWGQATLFCLDCENESLFTRFWLWRHFNFRNRFRQWLPSGPVNEDAARYCFKFIPFLLPAPAFFTGSNSSCSIFHLTVSQHQCNKILRTRSGSGSCIDHVTLFALSAMHARSADCIDGCPSWIIPPSPAGIRHCRWSHIMSRIFHRVVLQVHIQLQACIVSQFYFVQGGISCTGRSTAKSRWVPWYQRIKTLC